MSNLSVKSLLKKKKVGEKIVAVTAYDCLMARFASEAGIDVVLVGDSLGMVVLGYETTLEVTMEDMIHHCKAVKRGNSTAFLVGDMPFMSYQSTPGQAVKNAGRFLQEGGMQAVKLEGGRRVGKNVRAILDAGIPVMGHLGVLPQSVHKYGGYAPRGRMESDAKEILDDAFYLESLGVFAIVLECLDAALAATITAELKIPTIGIGAGKACDGQILVCHDVLGMTDKTLPRFVKQYTKLGETIPRAFEKYKRDVLRGRFPTSKHTYS